MKSRHHTNPLRVTLAALTLVAALSMSLAGATAAPAAKHKSSATRAGVAAKDKTTTKRRAASSTARECPGGCHEPNPGPKPDPKPDPKPKPGWHTECDENGNNCECVEDESFMDPEPGSGGLPGGPRDPNR